MNNVQIKVTITGRVQGVSYRDWVVMNAHELHLRGWVRNRIDGSVEAVFAGPEDRVALMIERCYDGPPLAKVTNIQQTACNDDIGSIFERLPTA